MTRIAASGRKPNISVCGYLFHIFHSLTHYGNTAQNSVVIVHRLFFFMAIHWFQRKTKIRNQRGKTGSSQKCVPELEKIV